MSEVKMKQLHVDIPAELHEKLSSILTEKGMTSAVIRRLLQIYVESVENGDPVIPNMIGKRGGGEP